MTEHRDTGDDASTTQDNQVDDYPATYRPEKVHLNPSKDFDAFLKYDLSVDELEDDVPYLWMAGRPYFPRSLSIQRVLNRTIVPTNEASLHLVWTTGKIFIKAFPRYILAESFYDDYLQFPKPKSPSALGLLYTYVALVPTELDFKLAQDHSLFPPCEELTWPKWKRLARRTIEDHPSDIVHQRIPKRYIYGELRLSRLNKIHMFAFGSWTYGYSRLTSTQRYVEFFSRNFGLLTASFAWVVVVLTAMQVALMTDMLKDSSDVQRVCAVVAAIAIVLPFIAVAIIIGQFLFIFFAHLLQTGTVHKARDHEVGGISRAKPRASGTSV